MIDVVSRLLIRQWVESDPAARPRYDEMLANARELTRDTGENATS